MTTIPQDDLSVSDEAYTVEEADRNITAEGGALSAPHSSDDYASPNSYADVTILLPIGLLEVNSFNPNKLRNHHYMGLCAELRSEGINRKPIVCRQNGKRNEIIDGEHTWRAALEVGLKEVVVTIKKNCSDYDARRLCIVSNIAGEPDPLKLGRVLRQMLDAKPSLTFEQVGKDVSIKKGKVAYLLQYAELARVRPDLESEVPGMTVRKVRALLGNTNNESSQERKTLAIQSLDQTSSAEAYSVTILGKPADFEEARKELLDLACWPEVCVIESSDAMALQEIKAFARLIDAGTRSGGVVRGVLNKWGAVLIYGWGQRMGFEISVGTRSPSYFDGLKIAHEMGTLSRRARD